MDTKLVGGALAAILLLGMPIALWSAQWSALAQAPPAPKVGQTLTVTSFDGIATQIPANHTKGRNQGPPTETPVSVQLTWLVIKVNSGGSWAFNITGGTVTVGSESYKVTKGRGFVSPAGQVHWGLKGTTNDGETITWACSGLLATLGAQTINAMNGILKEKDQRYNIRFLATVQ